MGATFCRPFSLVLGTVIGVGFAVRSDGVPCSRGKGGAILFAVLEGNFAVYFSTHFVFFACTNKMEENLETYSNSPTPARQIVRLRVVGGGEKYIYIYIDMERMRQAHVFS